MAPMRKKNRSGGSQLRRFRVRFPISSSFCFRRALFLPRLIPLPVSETMALMRKKNRSGRSQLRRFRVRFPISCSFCFRRVLFLSRLIPVSVSETMAPIRKKNRPGKSQLRRLQKMEKKVSKQRAEQIRAKESVVKDKAELEEKAIKLAERRRFIELCKKEIACRERCIDLTLGIFAAEDESDFARAECLNHSRSELLAKMKEEIQAFMNV